MLDSIWGGGGHKNLKKAPKVYNMKSAEGSICVRQGGESGQMGLKKWNGPILMHIYDKQCVQNFRFGVLQWDVRMEIFAKNMEN